MLRSQAGKQNVAQDSCWLTSCWFTHTWKETLNTKHSLRVSEWSTFRFCVAQNACWFIEVEVIGWFGYYTIIEPFWVWMSDTEPAYFSLCFTSESFNFISASTWCRTLKDLPFLKYSLKYYYGSGVLRVFSIMGLLPLNKSIRGVNTPSPTGTSKCGLLSEPWWSGNFKLLVAVSVSANASLCRYVSDTSDRLAKFQGCAQLLHHLVLHDTRVLPITLYTSVNKNLIEIFPIVRVLRSLLSSRTGTDFCQHWNFFSSGISNKNYICSESIPL